MAVHADLTPTEAADRLAIRELFDAYAHCADRRERRGSKGALHRRYSLRRLHGREGSEVSYVWKDERFCKVLMILSVRGDDSLQWAEHDNARRRLRYR